MPLITAAPRAIRRHLLIAATATNRSGFGDISAGVRKEIETARTLFLDVLGYDRGTFKELVDPGPALQTEVSAWRRQVAPTANDWLLVYYTGHGVERGGALHLITSDTQEGDEETAPTADGLARALLGGEKVPPHALLILDTCHSGAAHSDVTNAAARVRESTGGAARAADFHVVATARSIASASVGRFMETLTKVLRSPLALNPADEHVDIQHLVEQVNGSIGREQRASYSGAGESALRFIPNPRWQPRLRLTMDRETRARVLHRIQIQALRSHWDPRARGVSNADTAGWYFTGRAKPIGFINQWLSGPSDSRGLVVTALAGSGKSALLARIATLADPLLRQAAEAAEALSHIPAAELPNPGAIDAAVHARAKDPEQLALEIAAALDVELSSGGTDAEMEMVAKVAGRAAPFTIVIDALDESVRPDDCALLLRKLANKSQRGRLIVGVRESGTEPPGLSSLLGPAFERIDLDVLGWRDPDDVRRYVERYLQFAPGSPYGDREAEPVTRRLADAVARRADTSFLVASATAYALASRPTVVEPADLDPLPATVGEALALDLERFGGVAGEQLRHVLTALACAEGRGLPRDMWLAMAAALSDGDVTDSDLDRWSKDAAFYLVRDDEFGERVRRLYHEEFAAHLRRGVDAAGEAAIADALLRTVPRAAEAAEPEWDRASTYLLAFYSRHLNRAGRMRDLSELSSATAWIQAKRQRFGDIGWVLADLDLAIAAARAEHPAALARVVRGCAKYAGFVASAPPIVIDTVAGLLQPTRAQAMAETIEFPLDRCHAFALVSARWAALGVSQRAIDCVRTAERAAHGVRAHFETLAKYWVVRAARIAGDTEVTTRVISAVRGQLEAIRGALGRADQVSDAAALDDAKLKARVRSWAEARSLDAEERTFALPHWLFWASMCFREVGDVEGCNLIREHVMALETGEAGHWSEFNLVLQTAAVTGAVKYLRNVARTWSWADAQSLGWAKPAFAGGIAKPGNVALALVDAGLCDEFDRLRAAGAFDELFYADSTKRYAWALARRGDFDAALNTAASISDDHEEQARALYRIGCEAVAAGKRDILDRLASAAAALQALPHDSESWRIDSWLGAVMLTAGRTADAQALAESVSAAGVVAGESTCLAMATPRTAQKKQHVRLEADATAYAALRDEVLQRARSNGTASGRDYLKTQPASVRTTAELLLNLATMETDPAHAFDLWVDAIIASRRAGTTMLRNVLADGASILAHSTAGETSASLLASVTDARSQPMS